MTRGAAQSEPSRGSRILYVIDGLNIGGAEMLLIGLVDAALARGAEVHVAYFTPGPLAAELAARGIATTRLSAHGARDPRALWRAYALMRRWRPDVVHTHLVKSDFFAQPAAWAAGVPLRLVTLHNTDPWLRRRPLNLAYRLATAGAHAHVAVSGVVGDYAVAAGGISAARLRVIDNGVDLARFDPASAAPLDLESFGVAGECPLVGVIGRLAPQKDHANFVAAAALLAERAPSARFVIVGEGELRGAIEADVRARGLGPGRVVLTGAIRDMPALLARLDVVVFSSAWEGLPMVLIEAMAMGRAVVATAVGAIPSVIEEGRDGLLVPPGDPEALAGAIARLAGDPALRADLGRAARAKAEARFGARAMIENLFDLYETGARGAA